MDLCLGVEWWALLVLLSEVMMILGERPVARCTYHNIPGMLNLYFE